MASAHHDLLLIEHRRGEDRYLFLFDEASRCALLRTLGRFACNPELNFSWHDAAVLSQQVRRAVDGKSSRYNGFRTITRHNPEAGGGG